jgi:zinc transport system permease protein
MINFMFDFWHLEFMKYAFISAAILGPACALLGVFVTLRGMSFFSDAIAHSALSGIAIGYLLQEWFKLPLDPMVVVFIFSFALASAMSYFFEKTSLKPDTIIAFSFTGSVALGVVIISSLGKYRLIDGLLFGSIYANSFQDILKQLGLAIGICVFLLWNVKTYALTILQPDLAKIQGMKLQKMNYLFILIIAATVTICMKMVGALLLSALLVIPSASAKLISKNFTQMLWIAPLLGLIASCLGVIASYHIDSPTGPTIVLSHVVFLLGCLLYSLKLPFLSRKG